MADQIIYTAEALSTGAGREGHVRTSDGRIDLDMTAPTEMGGSGNGANPELLFAAGYAACFHSALLAVAKQQSVELRDEAVGSRVHFHKGDDGFHLSVDLEVVIPGVPHDQAQALAEAAHQMCPYSKATRGNVEVKLSASEG